MQGPDDDQPIALPDSGDIDDVLAIATLPGSGGTTWLVVGAQGAAAARVWFSSAALSPIPAPDLPVTRDKGWARGHAAVATIDGRTAALVVVQQERTGQPPVVDGFWCDLAACQWQRVTVDGPVQGLASSGTSFVLVSGADEGPARVAEASHVPPEWAPVGDGPSEMQAALVANRPAAGWDSDDGPVPDAVIVWRAQGDQDRASVQVVTGGTTPTLGERTDAAVLPSDYRSAVAIARWQGKWLIGGARYHLPEGVDDGGPVWAPELSRLDGGGWASVNSTLLANQVHTGVEALTVTPDGTLVAVTDAAGAQRRIWTATTN